MTNNISNIRLLQSHLSKSIDNLNDILMDYEEDTLSDAMYDKVTDIIQELEELKDDLDRKIVTRDNEDDYTFPDIDVDTFFD